MKKYLLPASTLLLLFFVAFLGYRQLDMAVAADDQQSQIQHLEEQQKELVNILNKLAAGVSRSQIERISPMYPLFSSTDGETTVIGSLKYEFKDDRCIKVSIND